MWHPNAHTCNIVTRDIILLNEYDCYGLTVMAFMDFNVAVTDIRCGHYYMNDGHRRCGGTIFSVLMMMKMMAVMVCGYYRQHPCTQR